MARKVGGEQVKHKKFFPFLLSLLAFSILKRFSRFFKSFLSFFFYSLVGEGWVRKAEKIGILFMMQRREEFIGNRWLKGEHKKPMPKWGRKHTKDERKYLEKWAETFFLPFLKFFSFSASSFVQNQLYWLWNRMKAVLEQRRKNCLQSIRRDCW